MAANQVLHHLYNPVSGILHPGLGPLCAAEEAVKGKLGTMWLTSRMETRKGSWAMEQAAQGNG